MSECKESDESNEEIPPAARAETNKDPEENLKKEDPIIVERTEKQIIFERRYESDEDESEGEHSSCSPPVALSCEDDEDDYYEYDTSSG